MLMINIHCSFLVFILKQYQKVQTLISKQLLYFLIEDTDIDSSVITLTAVDPDSSNLTYSIIAGNDLNYFKIDSATGVIKVNSELDRETATNIQLRVMVTDNTFNVRNYTNNL